MMTSYFHRLVRGALLVALVSLVAAALPGFAQGTAHASGLRASRIPTEIMFQAFDWNAAVNGQKYVWYRHVATKADDLAVTGVTHVWFPPAARSVAPQGYMPGDLYDLGHGDELGDNRTLYGNEAELKSCLQILKQKGMECLADIVINHRCGSHQDGGFWNVFHHPSGKAMWEKWALSGGDNGGTGKPDTGDDFGAAPDLDHTNAKVRNDIVEWMLWLKNSIGFDGWRFDYTKGYGAQYVKEYIEKTSPSFAIGELWTSLDYDQFILRPNQNAHRQKLCDWIDGTSGLCSSFDFTTKGILQESLKSGEFWRLRDSEGKAAGLIGWWPDKAVTFVDNHDTGPSQNHWPFPSDKVLAGYAYIMTHPGIPMIYWDHLYAWGQEHHDTIQKLAQLRQQLRLNRASKLEILVAENGRYVGRVDGKVTLLLGGGWQPEAGWQQRMAGPGFVIWVKG